MKKAKKSTQDLSSTCSHCGMFDPDFDEESMLMHQFKECVMVLSLN